MKTAVWAAAFLIGVNVLAAFAGEGEVLRPPAANLPWEHGESGLRLPGELVKMMAEQVYGYETAALGYVVRYSTVRRGCAGVRGIARALIERQECLSYFQPERWVICFPFQWPRVRMR